MRRTWESNHFVCEPIRLVWAVARHPKQTRTKRKTKQKNVWNVCVCVCNWIFWQWMHAHKDQDGKWTTFVNDGKWRDLKAKTNMCHKERLGKRISISRWWKTSTSNWAAGDCKKKKKEKKRSQCHNLKDEIAWKTTTTGSDCKPDRNACEDRREKKIDWPTRVNRKGESEKEKRKEKKMTKTRKKVKKKKKKKTNGDSNWMFSFAANNRTNRNVDALSSFAPHEHDEFEVFAQQCRPTKMIDWEKQ